MKNKTLWIGFIVVFVVVQVYSYLVHGVMLAGTYEKIASAFRPEQEMMSMMWLLTISSAAALFLFCYIFTKGYEGRGIGEGARYGFLMGLFMAIPLSIEQYVSYPLPRDIAVIWFLASFVSFVIAGTLFAAIYKPSTA